MLPVVKTQRRRKETLKRIAIPVYCICRLPDSGSQMFGWLKWFHAGVLVGAKKLGVSMTIGIVLPAYKVTFTLSTEIIILLCQHQHSYVIECKLPSRSFPSNLGIRL